jgi:general secretion pathway protein K
MIVDKYKYSPKQRGAVLLIVLVIALVLSVLIAVASTVIERRIQNALQARQTTTAIVLANTKLQELTYALAVHPITVAGVRQQIPNEEINLETKFNPVGDEIRLDGHQYLDANGLKYSIQGSSGLIPFNSADQFWLVRFLQANGVTGIEQKKMLDRLYDYADANRRSKALGFEPPLSERGQLTTFDTLQLKAAHPNYLLQNCSEIKRLFSTGQKNALENAPDFCSLGRGSAINLNSMPRALFELLFPNSAKDIFQAEYQTTSEPLSQSVQTRQWMMSEQAAINTIPELINIPDDYYNLLFHDYFILTIGIGSYTKVAKIKLGVGEIPPISSR